MKIKKIAFGNEISSFIEDRITDGVNIIFSDDNNRGKTLVMQGLMYSLGYEAIFPSSFNYRDQYFYSQIERDGQHYEFLRKNNSFVIKAMEFIQVFNSERDFRYFFDSNLFKLPRIIKDNRLKMVDFSLFYEMFFIGQDNRSSSSLISKGQFNKADFKSMIFSLGGIQPQIESEKDINELKEMIKALKHKQNSIKKKMSLIKANPNIAEIAEKSFDSQAVQDKIKILQTINERISEIRRARQREINRKAKLEALIKELNSLNKGLSEGGVKCGECGSDKIIYSNDDLTFEVSNSKVRANILASIQRNILQKQEIIDEHSSELNLEQDNLQAEMKSSPPDFQQIVVYQDNILSDKGLDDEAISLLNEINALENELKLKQSLEDDNKNEQKDLLKSILEEMLKNCRVVDPSGNLTFDDLFTKKDVTFSGSEEQEYYFSRLIALNNILGHDFPIIVDSFRDGEISTDKELKMLEIYKSLGKQVILTATLKKEEYISQKYTSDDKLNALDYSNHANCEILQNKNSAAFINIVKSFEGIIL